MGLKPPIAISHTGIFIKSQCLGCSTSLCSAAVAIAPGRVAFLVSCMRKLEARSHASTPSGAAQMRRVKKVDAV
jgi:hypothetical protein